jgi:hypothetical protein
MNTTEKDIELFDSYMDGTMSDTDRTQFEERLRNDEAYRKAYELHSEVVLGIQRKELKAMLQEQEMQSSTDVPVAANVAEGGRTISMFIKLAVAACFFIGVCFVGYDFWKLSSLGGDYIAQLEQPVPRGSGVEETLVVIHDDLQQGNYSEAKKNIEKARQLIAEEQSITYPTEEETEYHQQMLKLDSDELDWYQALVYVKTHKVFKAKRLLKQIVNSDSKYKEEAKALLK